METDVGKRHIIGLSTCDLDRRCARPVSSAPIRSSRTIYQNELLLIGLALLGRIRLIRTLHWTQSLLETA